PRIDGGHLACFKRFPVLFPEKSPERMLPLLTPRKRFDYIRSRAQWRSTWSPMSRPRWPPCTIFHLPFVARLLTRRAGTCRRLPESVFGTTVLPTYLLFSAQVFVRRIRSPHSCALQSMPGPPARLCAWAGACWAWGLVALICMNRLAHQPERMFLLRRKCEADASQDRSRCMQSRAGHAAEPYAMI